MDKIENLYELRLPNSNRNYFDKLSNEEKTKYLELYVKYSKCLYQYLIKKLDLKKYDDMILNSGNKFKKVDVEYMDLYQYLAKDYLNFFYLRNNLYIERLSEEEKNYLNTIDVYDENVEKFIENTYIKVCLELPNEKVNVCYGADSLVYYKPSDCILLGYRFDNYYKDENTTDQEWVSENQKRLFELELIEMGLSKKYKDLLKAPIYFQIYDDYSVMCDVDNRIEYL